MSHPALGEQSRAAEVLALGEGNVKGVLKWSMRSFNYCLRTNQAVEWGHCSPKPSQWVCAGTAWPERYPLRVWTWTICSLSVGKCTVLDTSYSSHYRDNWSHTGPISFSQVQLQCQGHLSSHPRPFLIPTYEMPKGTLEHSGKCNPEMYGH